MFEVKSTRSRTFNEEGLRQIQEWMTTGLYEHQKDYKGIFVGNSDTETPWLEREFPFEANWIRTAERQEVSAILSETPYIVWTLDAQGTLDRDAFWRELFETNGVMDRDAWRARYSAPSEP